MVALKQGLLHAQSALTVLQRLLILAQSTVRHPNVVQQLSNVGVVVLKQGLLQAQSALIVLHRLFVLAQSTVCRPNAV